AIGLECQGKIDGHGRLAHTTLARRYRYDMAKPGNAGPQVGRLGRRLFAFGSERHHGLLDTRHLSDDAFGLLPQRFHLSHVFRIGGDRKHHSIICDDDVTYEARSVDILCPAWLFEVAGWRQYLFLLDLFLCMWLVCAIASCEMS